MREVGGRELCVLSVLWEQLETTGDGFRPRRPRPDAAPHLELRGRVQGRQGPRHGVRDNGALARTRGNIVAGLRTIAGGEIKEYTELAKQARQEALDRLSDHAKNMGANAVLSVMFDSTEMAASMEEIIAFGTAVIVSPVSGDQQLVKLS